MERKPYFIFKSKREELSQMGKIFERKENDSSRF